MQILFSLSLTVRIVLWVMNEQWGRSRRLGTWSVLEVDGSVMVKRFFVLQQKRTVAQTHRRLYSPTPSHQTCSAVTDLQCMTTINFFIRG